jgi:16S rRNA (cytidine1402-2'-O)-methyltransferase
VSDPGAVLVRAVRDAGFTVVPVPGASAFAALVSVAGGLDKTVIFEGFLSPKSGRRRSRLAELLAAGEGFVVYESPFGCSSFWRIWPILMENGTPASDGR